MASVAIIPPPSSSSPWTAVTLFARDIVVGLFHLAGIEEDEDLLYSCTEDVRSYEAIPE